MVDYRSRMPIEDAHNAKDAEDKLFELVLEENSPTTKERIAKYSFLIFIFCVACLVLASRSESKYPTGAALGISILLALMTKQYQKNFASIPFQSVGARLFLDSQRAQHIALDTKIEQSLHQVGRVGSFFHTSSGARRFHSFNRDITLENALNDSDIYDLEHSAMVLALFCVQNGAFDCVAISALVTLKLIEKKIPAPIERIAKPGTNVWDAHSFIIVNRSQGNPKDIATWNTDCIIIDPWYGICKKTGEIQADLTFF